MAKYTPKTIEELRYLVQDESIYLGDIDTSNITDMSYLFSGITRNDFSGIDSWDTSKVVDMGSMFANAKSFNENINSWDTSNVVNMNCMFYNAKSFNQSLDKWDTSNVVNMVKMFNGAKSFNQNIDSWNVSNVKVNESFGGMFKDSNMENLPIWWSNKKMDFDEQEKMTHTIISKSIIKRIEKDAQSNKYVPKTRKELWALCYDKSISLGSIDTSNIVDMSSLFQNNDRRDFSGIDSWDTSNVVSMHHMFCGHESFNEPLDKWDTSSVEFMTKMFYGAESFNQNVDSWNVSSVRDNQEMFWESGISKLPKWYKKRAITDNIVEMTERCVAEVMMNPRPKKPKIAPQSNKTNDDWEKSSLKSKIITIFSICFVVAFCFNLFKSIFVDSDTKSQPKQTQSAQQKQTQPAKPKQPVQNILRCDNKDLLNHLIKTYKNESISGYKDNPESIVRLQEILQKKGITFTDIDDFVNQYKINIIKVQTYSSDEANKHIFCEAKMEITYTSLAKPFYSIAGYRVRLKDDNTFEFEFLGVRD